MKLYYLAAVAVVAVAFAISVPILNSSRDDFSTYNTEWNGCSSLKENTKQNYSVADVFSMVDSLKGKDRGVVVLLNPNKRVSVTGSDIAALQHFVRNGGSLLIANDFGNGNDVLDRLGLGTAVTFNTSLLYDNSSNWSGAEYPIISSFSPSNFTNGIETLYFNYGTTLDVKDNATVTVLANSSPSSYVSEPGQSEANQSQGAKPVLAYLDYGKGKVILLSDPSIFINSMNMGDNQRLFNNIIATLNGGGKGDRDAQVLFDESHRMAQPLWSVVYEKMHADDMIKYAMVLLTMSLFVATLNVRRVQTKRNERPAVSLTNMGIDEDIIIDDIVQRNPRWAKGRIKKLTQHLRTREQEKEDERKDDNR